MATIDTPHGPSARQAREEAFIERLGTLDPGERARLKRNAGNTLGESRGVLDIFYHLLPWGVPEHDHKHYFLLATLYPLAGSGGARNFGATLHRVREVSGSPSIDRRFSALLDASDEQLPFRLRQLVRLAKSHEVGINWLQLLHDLLRWNYAGRRVQQQWASAYFEPSRSEPGANDGTTAGQ